MKPGLIAAGLSVALHGGVLLWWAQPAAVRVVEAPGAKPVQIEVLRLAGVISGTKRAAPAVAATPVARPANVRPAAASPPFDRLRMSGGASSDVAGETGALAQDERGTAEVSGPTGPETGTAGDSSPQLVGVELLQIKTEPAPLDTAALSARLQQVALRCYPAAARRFRQTGEAQIRFCLDAAGTLRESTVIHSTGSELLDHAATACVVPGAAPFGPETFGRCFTVPVRFNL